MKLFRFARFALLVATVLTSVAAPAHAQTVPVGCVDGQLSDPRAYFFSLIDRAEGQPATDFAGVLRQLAINGMRVNPRPGEHQPLDAAYHGLTLMVGGDGGPRGRIWLPTDVANIDEWGNAWFTHEIQVIDDAPGGGLQWRWRDIGGAPYA